MSYKYANCWQCCQGSIPCTISCPALWHPWAGAPGRGRECWKAWNEFTVLASLHLQSGRWCPTGVWECVFVCVLECVWERVCVWECVYACAWLLACLGGYVVDNSWKVLMKESSNMFLKISEVYLFDLWTSENETLIGRIHFDIHSFDL